MKGKTVQSGAAREGTDMKKKKKRISLSTALLMFLLLIGISLLLYPSVSDYWNSFHQSRAIATYAESVAELDNEEYKQMWYAAKAYNRSLTRRENHWFLTEEEQEEYESLLNVGGNGVMGYVEIPAINVALPIYHGVDEAVLQIAIGHLEGSSLPVGGVGSHCVISGHRGLPSAKLFSDLDQLTEGDIFLLRVLDETLTYEVDQILIVEPEDVSALEPDSELDLCTLVTCTPYGVNSHRLLVRGHRVENQEEALSVRVTADAQQIEPSLVAPLVAAPVLLLLLFWMLFSSHRRR